jgi:hypothetical protein
MLRRWDEIPEFMRVPEVKVYYDILKEKEWQIALKRITDFFLAFFLLIVLSTVLEESYMIKDHVSDRMQRESAARMEQYIASVSRMEPSK